MHAGRCLIRLLAIGACCGCSQPESSLNAPQEVRQHAELPRTSLTHNRELQAELARLKAEQATPLALSSATAEPRHATPNAGAPTDAARLNDIFATSQRNAVMKRLAEIWPPEEFKFPPTTLRVVDDLLSTNRRRIDRFEQLIDDPNFSPKVDHSMGLMMETSFLDTAEVGSRLLGLRASTSLSKGQLDAAIKDVARMLRVAELLGREKNVAARAAAAHRRRDSLQILEAIVLNPAASRGIQRRLNDLLTHQLNHWPADEESWVGDRALGLHTYELIRDGYLLSLLTDSEYRDLDKRVGLKELAKVVRQNIDVDELFYLQAMRELIAACQQPFHQRRALFRRIERDLKLLGSGDSYPFVADQLLLVEIEPMQRLHAIDRARCEAWQLALQLALDGDPQTKRLNPLTGSPFIVEVTPNHVTVDAIDSEGAERAATLPIRRETAAQPALQR